MTGSSRSTAGDRTPQRNEDEILVQKEYMSCWEIQGQGSQAINHASANDLKEKLHMILQEAISTLSRLVEPSPGG